MVAVATLPLTTPTEGKENGQGPSILSPSFQGSGVLASTVMKGMVFRREVEGQLSFVEWNGALLGLSQVHSKV